MLGVFSSAVAAPPEELAAAAGRSPSPKTKASELVARFLSSADPAVAVNVNGDGSHLAFSHLHDSPFSPRSFAVKDDIFCVFRGAIENISSLKQHYGLSKKENEVIMVIEAYKALRDRAPFPPSQMVALLRGSFAFLIFDRSSSSLFAAADPHGEVPFFWGTTADGFLAFADDLDLLRGACGKSIAAFPRGCFYCTNIGGLKSYENPKNKITAVPASEEEIWGATFKEEATPVFAAIN
ncbi:aluminum induced protein with YGL and LRDR motifs [Wolffia australiana]